MAVRASATVTISCYRDTQSVTRYYKLQSSTASAPSKPTTKPPTDWTDTEPSYTSGSTNTLYFCDLTVFSNGEWEYSAVSKSSSYEAAKEAWNKANAAQDSADDANDKIDNLEIGGRNLLQQFIKAGSRCTLVDDLTVKVGTSSTVGDTYFYLKAHCDLIAGEIYTISCEASNVPDGCNWSFGIGADASSNTWRLVLNKNGKLSATGSFSTNKTAGSNFFVDDIDGRPTTAVNIVLTNFKLEKGNKATDWTPAPEDVDNQIDEASKVATNYMDFESGRGLIVGDMTKTTLGKNILIDSDSVDIRDGDVTLATFAATSKEVVNPVGTTVTRDVSEVTSMYDTSFGTYKSYGAELNCNAGISNYTSYIESALSSQVQVGAAISNPDSGTNSYKETYLMMFSANTPEEGVFSRTDLVTDYLYIKPERKLAFNVPIDTNGNCNHVFESSVVYLGTNATNRPEDKNGWLETLVYTGDAGYRKQIFTTYTGEIYKRFYQGGTWGNWTAGLTNHKKLWYGTLSAGGSVTVADLDKYDMFMARTSDGNTMLIGVRYYTDTGTRSTAVRFVGGYSDTSNAYVFMANATMNGTALGLVNCSKTIMNTAVTKYTLTFKSLWGLM